jgi:hypothetical protein
MGCLLQKGLEIVQPFVKPQRFFISVDRCDLEKQVVQIKPGLFFARFDMEGQVKATALFRDLQLESLKKGSYDIGNNRRYKVEELRYFCDFCLVLHSVFSLSKWLSRMESSGKNKRRSGPAVASVQVAYLTADNERRTQDRHGYLELGG